MLITIIILVLSAVFFVNGKIRSDLVALCALVALLIFQILTPDEALSGFSNSVVIMMVGLFVVGGAIFQTGLAKMISSHILKLAGKSELKLFLLVMLVTSAIGAFVSNTGTVALMLPIVVSLAVSANMNPKSLAYAFGFCQQYGRYDDTDWYAAQPCYSKCVDFGRFSSAFVLLFFSGRDYLCGSGYFGVASAQ